MYLRHTTLRKDGKVHRYWRLVRSVRVGRRVIQRTVAHLGELDEGGRIEARALARHVIGTPECAQLFNDGSGRRTVAVRLMLAAVTNGTFFGDGQAKGGVGEMPSARRRDTVPCMHSGESGEARQPVL
jgi:hypothetical protein